MTIAHNPDSYLDYQDFYMPKVIRFGVNTLQTLPEWIEKYTCKKIAVISDKGIEKAGLAEKVVDFIQSLSIPYCTYTEIIGEPTFPLVEDVITFVEKEQCDMVIGIGGGSAIDVAKTVAALIGKDNVAQYLYHDKTIEVREIPCIILPTTAGTGAEVTMNAIFGDKEKELKKGIVSPALLPDVAIIDPSLTFSCPTRVTASSGVDAFTHAIESYVSPKATPMTKAYAEKAMSLFPGNIYKAVFNGKELPARIGMSWVSHLAGISLANAGVGAVHALSYPLGGKYNIEHGVANALLMPYVFEVTGEAIVTEMVEVANLLKLGDFWNCPHEATQSVVKYLHQLVFELGLPTNLKDLQVAERDLPILAKQAFKVKRLLDNTPYELNESEILTIYENAYVGRHL